MDTRRVVGLTRARWNLLTQKGSWRNFSTTTRILVRKQQKHNTKKIKKDRQIYIISLVYKLSNMILALLFSRLKKKKKRKLLNLRPLKIWYYDLFDLFL